MSSPLLFLLVLSFISVSTAQTHPHGLQIEGPMAFSPDAYAFFHPGPTMSQSPSPAAARTKTLLLATTVQSTPAHESKASGSRHGLGFAGVAGICLSLALMCLIGMGVYYVMIRRWAGLDRAINNPKQPVDV